MVQHRLFLDEPDNEHARGVSYADTQSAVSYPIASTSTAILPSNVTSANGSTPVFKKRKAKKSSVDGTSAVANGAGNGRVEHSSKRVRTFYEDAERDDEDDMRHAGNSKGPSIPASNVPVNGEHNSKETKQKQRAERKARADHLMPARQKLPVWHAKDSILEEIEKLDTVIVLGETGSGKTTQIPQFLLNSRICRPQPRIVVTQPRRVAATSLARRVAEECGCALGSLVGYTVRFDDCSSDKTRLKYVTDGTLLQEILSDKLLEAYDIVIIDEAHERTLRTDMILGFLKQIQRRRKEMARTGERAAESQQQVGPLKIIVMSATLDAQRFSQFYDDAKVLYVKGREFKVSTLYLDQPPQDYIEAATKTIFQIHYKTRPGDILVFMSGQDDIEALRAQLESYLPSLDPQKQRLLICPLYARLTPAEQNKAFNMAPPNTRKIILATNVAETSITISGISCVIDCGFAKEKTYHPTSGMDSLLLSPISKSSATQRAGRAGRERDGQCYRLYTEIDYHKLRPTVPPEIQRCSLAFALLHLKAAGQDDVANFDYMDKPADEAIIAALYELHQLGALDDNGHISPAGIKMAALPLEPRHSRCLLASVELDCPREMIDLLALLGSAEQLINVPHIHRENAAQVRSKFIHRTGDHMMLLNILRAFEDVCANNPSRAEQKQWCQEHFLSLKVLNQVLDARKQLRERAQRLGIDWKVSVGEDDEPVLTALLHGMSSNTAMRLPDNSYRRTNGAMRVKIHPSSILQGKRPDALVFSELIYTSSIYVRIVSSIPLIWLRTKTAIPNGNNT